MFCKPLESNSLTPFSLIYPRPYFRPIRSSKLNIGFKLYRKKTPLVFRFFNSRKVVFVFAHLPNASISVVTNQFNFPFPTFLVLISALTLF
jgi:hypothetical protein